jgi:histidyl-tRNA synthetase
LKIPFSVKPNLVRGLDYYVQTTFEFTTKSIDAAQDAIGGGGRYDGLAEEMGAPSTPGVGFALGLDRTLMACDAEKTFLGAEQLLQIYVVDTTGGEYSLVVTDQLRQNGFRVDRSFGDRSMKAQMKAADKSGAKIAVIIGEDEVKKGVVTIRDLRGEEGQEEIASDAVIANLRKRLG